MQGGAGAASALIVADPPGEEIYDKFPGTKMVGVAFGCKSDISILQVVWGSPEGCAVFGL